MTNLRDFDDVTVEALPDVEDNFASPAVFRAATPVAAGDKVTGSSDSVKNNKTTVKASGGNDASKQKDGG